MKMIEILSKKSNAKYFINLGNVEFYEIGVYDHNSEGVEAYYIEFYCNTRHLRFVCEAGLYKDRDEIENALKYYDKAHILVSEEV